LGYRMSFEDALRRYRENRFTDADIMACTGLGGRAYRELIKRKALRTVTERRGPGRVRLCDATTLKRTAAIAAVHRAGWSLQASGQIASCIPLRTLLYEVCDPSAVLLRRSAVVDPKTGLPPRVECPKLDWFDLDRPAQAEPDDWLVEIYDGRFVGVLYGAKDQPTFFGDLREQGARFVAWFPFRHPALQLDRVIEFAQELNPGAVEATRSWEDPTQWIKELQVLAYHYEQHSDDADPLQIAAEASIRNALFKTTVNISLAVRKSLRCYLGIEPSAPDTTAEYADEANLKDAHE